jgi:hypothetical protein
MSEETKQLISNSKNVYLVPGQSHEAVAATLALFYTLQAQGKNVNVVMDHLPQELQFLSPSLDFISYPKNFVISVPNRVADIAQVYYEKTDDALKIHLTIEKGQINKDSLSFYFAETKPDVIITVGVQDYQKELQEKLNSFGFLLDSPIVDIDNDLNNKKFGTMNVVEEKSLASIISSLIESGTPAANLSLFTSLILYTDNFKKNLSADVFETAAMLMKRGLAVEEVTKNLKQT